MEDNEKIVRYILGIADEYPAWQRRIFDILVSSQVFYKIYCAENSFLRKYALDKYEKDVRLLNKFKKLHKLKLLKLYFCLEKWLQSDTSEIKL